MGFFFQQQGRAETIKRAARPRTLPSEMLASMGCKACPLSKSWADMSTPQMEAQGAEAPLLYFVGGWPSSTADAEGHPWAGLPERMVLRVLGPQARGDVRFSNAVQCFPGEKPAVAGTEVLCCSSRLLGDIERTKPLIVVGTADLETRLLGISGGVSKWRGRIMPARFGSHVCWYAVVQHPFFVRSKRRGKNKDQESEHDLAFRHDVERLYKLARTGSVPSLVEGSYADGLTRVNGQHARDIDTVASMLADLKRAPLVGLDIETTALRPYAIDRFKLPARIVTVSISTPTQGIAFPLDHPQGWAHDSHRLRAWRLLIDFLLESGRVVCHNLAFELEWLGYYIDPRITRLVSWECSQLQAHTLDERPDGLNLGDQTHIQFGFDVKKLSNLDAARILEYPIDEVLLYNALDAKWTARLFAERESDIHAVPDYQREYERKCRLASTLVLSQLQGVPVDLDYARQMEAVLSKEIADVLRKLSKCVEVQEFERRHGPFEPNNANVLLLLRDVLRRTDVSEGVSDSVAEEVLAAIPKSEALSPSLILEHRQASKLLSTYVLPVLNREIVFPDGLMHTVYKSWLARTGRLASEEPNLQNWPKRKRREIRGIVSVA